MLPAWTYTKLRAQQHTFVICSWLFGMLPPSRKTNSTILSLILLLGFHFIYPVYISCWCLKSVVAHWPPQPQPRVAQVIFWLFKCGKYVRELLTVIFSTLVVVRHPSCCLSSWSLSLPCSARWWWLLVVGLGWSIKPWCWELMVAGAAATEYREDYSALFSDGWYCLFKPRIPPVHSHQLWSLFLLHVGIHPQFLK